MVDSVAVRGMSAAGVRVVACGGSVVSATLLVDDSHLLVGSDSLYSDRLQRHF